MQKNELRLYKLYHILAKRFDLASKLLKAIIIFNNTTAFDAALEKNYNLKVKKLKNRKSINQFFQEKSVQEQKFEQYRIWRLDFKKNLSLLKQQINMNDKGDAPKQKRTSKIKQTLQQLESLWQTDAGTVKKKRKDDINFHSTKFQLLSQKLKMDNEIYDQQYKRPSMVEWLNQQFPSFISRESIFSTIGQPEQENQNYNRRQSTKKITWSFLNQKNLQNLKKLQETQETQDSGNTENQITINTEESKNEVLKENKAEIRKNVSKIIYKKLLTR